MIRFERHAAQHLLAAGGGWCDPEPPAEARREAAKRRGGMRDYPARERWRQLRRDVSREEYFGVLREAVATAMKPTARTWH